MKKLILKTKTAEFLIEFENNDELVEFVSKYTGYERKHDIYALYNLGDEKKNDN